MIRRSVPGGAHRGACALSKAEADEGPPALHRGHGLGLRIAVLPFVHGEGDAHFREARVRAAGRAAQRLALVHHAEAAQGLLRLLCTRDIAGRRYHVSDDAPVTPVDPHLVHAVPVPPELADRTDPDPWYGRISTLRIRDGLDFRLLCPSVRTARGAGAPRALPEWKPPPGRHGGGSRPGGGVRGGAPGAGAPGAVSPGGGRCSRSARPASP